MSTLIVVLFIIYWLVTNPKIFIESITFKYWNDGLEDKFMTVLPYLILIIAIAGDYYSYFHIE